MHRKSKNLSFGGPKNRSLAMLKSKALLSFFVLIYGFVSAQVYDPVDWEFKVEYQGDEDAELIFKAEIEDEWHVYATELPSEMGPIPTSVTLNESPEFKSLGSLKGGEFKTEYDPNFDMDLNFYDKEAIFRLPIKRLTGSDFEVTGYLTFMTCNDEMCLPPEDVDIKLLVKGAQKEAGDNPPPVGMAGSISEMEVLEPVKWFFSVEGENADSATLVFNAEIEETWHLYSTRIDPDAGGPYPTEFNFEESDEYITDGDLSESEAIVKYDSVFAMDVPFFEHQARFSQKIIKNSTDSATVKGYISFMVCDDGKCIMDEAEFEFKLSPGEQSDEVATTADAAIGGKGDSEKRSNWGIFIISFFSGFAALLTPCVFPMIPMTVSFFTKQSKTRAAGIKNAILYGISIIVIYVVLGVVVTAIFGASVLSELSTDPWFNLAFFLLLVIFAISFFGAFEITLPNSWISKADSRADRGGLIGIFFMAFVLALVSFSCTGPIVGTLIVEAASRGGSAPVIGMLGFSLAIALPFALFAAFPGWMNSLPKSGGWLNSVKVVLGFLELALAFKFLSNADLVLQLHLLEREVFIAIWIVIFGFLTLYLLGKIKLPHDSELKYLPVSRLILAIFTGVFTVYLIPGMWGAPLKLISAFPPPLQYSESPMGVGYLGGGGGVTVQHSEDQHVGPQGIYVYHDYEKALEHARQTGKPLMLDFTGHACVNCRKMEQQVWSDPEIKEFLSTEVVLASLYVDEKTPLPEEEQVTVELTGGRTKKLRNVGNKWAAFQEQRYGVNAQPYYVLLDHNENMLIEASNYQDYGTVELFRDWLSRGLKAFKEN